MYLFQLEDAIKQENVHGTCLHLSLLLTFHETSSNLELQLLKGSKHFTAIRLRKEDEYCQLSVDIQHSGILMADQQLNFDSRHLACKHNQLDIQVYVDRSSLEVFAADGAAVFSVRVFPDEGAEGISMTGNGIHFILFECCSLNSIWT